MTPQQLVAALLEMDDKQGQRLLQTYLPAFDDASIDLLVKLLKREADNQWATESGRSFLLAGHLLFIGDVIKSKYVHALGLMTRGDALRRMEHYREALPFLDAAGEEFLEIDDEVGWARTRIGRVSACLKLNRTSEALRDAAAAREIFMRYENYLRAGQIDVNAAMINYELGQYDQALRLFDRAIETYGLLGDGVDMFIARARGNKAITLAAMGRFREAVALHEQARATFASQQGQEVAVAREELNIAQIYAAQGHYSRALLLFNRSRAIFQSHDLYDQAAEVAQQTCLCLLRLNRTREAYELAGETITYFREVQLSRSPGHQDSLAHSLMCQAEAAMLEGEYRDADEKLQEASLLLEEIGFMGLAALVRLQQAELYFADGDLDASLREARHAADAFAEQEALPRLAQAALLQARIHANLGDTASAHYLCQQALDIAQGQDLLDLKYRCDYLLGQLAEHHGDLEAAARYYDRAVKEIDDVQGRLVMDERSSFLEDKGGVYQRAVILALRRSNTDQALVYVEKAKSRVLGDYLRNNIDIRLRAGDQAGEAILEDLERFREEQAWFSNIVYEAENEANLSDTAIMRIRAMQPGQARREMQQRERRIEQLLEQLQLRLAGDLVSRSRSHWTDSIVTSLREKLDHTTVMLEYYLTGQDLYIFQITCNGIDVHVEREAVPRLERLLSLWRVNLDLAAQASGAKDRAQAFAGLQENSLGLLQRLYDLLLRPVASKLSTCERLAIVPYGMLHYLPFHCLFDGVQFLVERLDVSYLPAAALMDICYERGRRIEASRVPLSRSLVMALSDSGKLAFAVHEAQAVAKQLGAPCVLNEAATTTFLRQTGPASPIVHIAAHGLSRLDAPNFSYIKLADHQLSTIEVFNLDLSCCSLVTLSACETGRATVGGVDEVIGLGRGFLYAGAASLLPTLWKVDDASSAELMEMFYQALLSDYDKAAALAGAQRAFLARARTSIRPYRVHPYFWAGFHLIGDPGPI
ncbi:MAG TPA: CHAT domain-containing protein [Ktedonobacteraceae bacterium]|nr:CHAT domain-containing protein [Ktedonobacteraceae bacterium]